MAVSSEEEEAFEDSAAVPVKTPGKKMNQAGDRKKRKNKSSLHAQVQSRCQTTGSKESPVLVSQVLIRTCQRSSDQQSFLMSSLMTHCE